MGTKKIFAALVFLYCTSLNVFPQSPQQDFPRLMFVTATAGLNVRSEPSTGSNVVRTLRYGEFIQIWGRSDEPVTIGGITDYWYTTGRPGVSDEFYTWVFGGYLSEELPEDLPVIIGKWDFMDELGINNNYVRSYLYFRHDTTFAYGARETDMGIKGTWSMDGDKVFVEFDNGWETVVENEDGSISWLPPEPQTAYLDLKTIDRNNIELSSGHPWFADRSPMRITRSRTGY